MKQLKYAYALIPVLLIEVFAAKATVRLPKLFSSGMVLQQKMKCPVWGWADKGEQISVQINGKQVKTRAGDDDKWICKLPEMNYGGPYILTVKGSNTIELTNVMIGEVWICGGQSNMGLQLASAKNAEQEIAAANYPDIRLFSVSQVIAQFPQSDLEQGHWAECTPATAKKFSAVGYFFGRDLYQKMHVPIGLISSNVGGTSAERWASPDNMLNDPDFKVQVQKLQTIDLVKQKQDRMNEIISLNGDFPDKDAGLKNGVAVYAQPDFTPAGWMDIQVPAAWNPLFVGVGWHRTSFNLTAVEATQPIQLHLGRIDDDDITYLNGKQIGTTMNVGDRVYKIAPEFLKAGDNLLAVRVVNRSGVGGMVGKPADIYVLTAGGAKKGLAGTWKFRLSEIPEHGLDIQKNDYPSILYNGMISPLMPYAIKGVIWYQGEGNAGQAKQYQHLFPNLIKDWRQHWGQGNFPFLFVSLANYKEPGDTSHTTWARLREAQAMALAQPNTGMALAIDVGDGNNLHPPNKQDVGYRLYLAALRVAYGQQVALSPLFKSAETKGNEIKITFTDTGGGLKSLDGDSWLHNFVIAGTDQKFYPANARLLDDHTVMVSAPEVSQPVAVRYAFTNNPEGLNLYNKEGLPATPFRTDDWIR